MAEQGPPPSSAASSSASSASDPPASTATATPRSSAMQPRRRVPQPPLAQPDHQSQSQGPSRSRSQSQDASSGQAPQPQAAGVFDEATLIAMLEAQNALLTADPRAVSQLTSSSTAASASASASSAAAPSASTASTPSPLPDAGPRLRSASQDALALGDTPSPSTTTTTTTALPLLTAPLATAASASQPLQPDDRGSVPDSPSSATNSELSGAVIVQPTLPNSPDEMHQQRLRLWADLLTGDTLENWWRRKPKRLAELIMAGIPAPLRCVAWNQLARVHGMVVHTPNSIALPSPLPAPANAYSTLLMNGDQDQERLIRRDIGRTFPDHPQFRESEGQEVLFNVLHAYSSYDPDVAYCQGLPFICAVLLMQTMPEETAFDLLVSMLHTYRLRGLYRPTMALLPQCLYQLERLVAETLPALHAHFIELELQPSTYASSWFLTLFASTLPLPVVFRVFDLFFFEGLPGLFRVCLAILQHNQDALLRQNFEGVVEVLSRTGLAARYAAEGSDDALMNVVNGISPVTHKKLYKLEQDYQRMKEAQAAQASELAMARSECERLKTENADLKSQMAQLEASYALLAKKHMDQTVRLEAYEEELESLQSKLSAVAASAAAVVSRSPSPLAKRGGFDASRSSMPKRPLVTIDSHRGSAVGEDLGVARAVSVSVVNSGEEGERLSPGSLHRASSAQSLPAELSPKSSQRFFAANDS